MPTFEELKPAKTYIIQEHADGKMEEVKIVKSGINTVLVRTMTPNGKARYMDNWREKADTIHRIVDCLDEEVNDPIADYFSKTEESEPLEE